jgi:hypothetical protein
MIRRAPIFLIAFAALAALGYEEATSQERTPTAPSKQIPPSSASLEQSVPMPPLSDPLIERTSQVAESDVASPANPLNELAWMVGDWIDADEHASIETSVKWSKNNAFLIRSFRVSNLTAEPLSGMQVIAWDPAEKRIRSWTYDSRGGFGEEAWSHAGDQWSMRTKFTRPDGTRASAVHVMTRAGDDSFRWKSVNRLIDGSLQPDIDEVTVVRKTTESATAAPDGAKPPVTNTPNGENQP